MAAKEPFQEESNCKGNENGHSQKEGPVASVPNVAHCAPQIVSPEDVEHLVAERTAELSEEIERLRQELAKAAASSDTKRIGIEEAVRKSEERYRLLAENSSDVIWTCDLDFQWRYISPSVEFLRGYTPTEAMGHTLNETLAPVSAGLARETLTDLLTSAKSTPSVLNRPVRLEVEMKHKDGSTVWAEVNVSFLRNDDGSPTGMVGVTRDITERKSVEEERDGLIRSMRESEVEHRLLLDNLQAGIVVHAPDTSVIVCNQAACNLLALTSDQVMGKTATGRRWKFLRENGTELPLEAYPVNLVANTKRPLSNYVVGVSTPESDALAWVLVNAYPVFTPAHELRHIVVTFVDVTERKRAEEVLKQKEYYLSKAQEIGSIGTWELDIVGNVLAWTDENYRIFGVPLGTSLSYETFLNCIYPDDREYVHQEWAKGMNHEPYDIEHRLLVDGRVKWVREKAEVVYGEDGDAVKAIGFTQDITERKAKEREASMLRSAIEQVPVGIALADTDLNLYFCNAAGLGMRGEGDRLVEIPKEAFGNWQVLRLNGEPYEIDELPLVKAVSKGLTTREEFLVKHQDGSEHICDAVASPVYDEVGIIGGLVIFPDITDRKRAEVEKEQLITTLEGKNAELERFAYTMSHDLKSPLITINGYVGMVKEDLAEGNTEEVQNSLKRISSAAKTMHSLLDEVLELSRIGRVIDPPEEMNFGDLAADAVDLVAGQIEQEGVHVVISPDLPVLYGDRSRLLEVVQNLLENAVKYMGDQPEPRIEIGVRREDGENTYYVRDNGMGIEPEHHERVFGLFNKLIRDSEGSGVGLAIAKRIVDVHGGRIWIETDGLGKGSTFCFNIPPKSAAEVSIEVSR